MRDGFVAVRGAFSEGTAAACRDLIWESLAGHGISRADRATWNPPLVRIDCPDGEPFAEAAASAKLAAACDELIGAGRRARRRGVGGTVPVRFPSEEYPGEVGYHIEGTWWGGSEYWTSLRSRGRGLLALFLFSDVGPGDAHPADHRIAPVRAADPGPGRGGGHARRTLDGSDPSPVARAIVSGMAPAG